MWQFSPVGELSLSAVALIHHSEGLEKFGTASQAARRDARRLELSLTHTVVAEAAVGGTWRSEDLAGEAVLQLDGLAVDDHLLRPGRGPVAGAAISHVFGRREERRDASGIIMGKALEERRNASFSTPQTLAHMALVAFSFE